MLEFISKYGDLLTGDASAKYSAAQKLIKKGIMDAAKSASLRNQLLNCLKFNIATNFVSGLITGLTFDINKPSFWVAGGGFILVGVSIVVAVPEIAAGSAAAATVGTVCTVGSHACSWISLVLSAGDK